MTATAKGKRTAGRWLRRDCRRLGGCAKDQMDWCREAYAVRCKRLARRQRAERRGK